MKYEDIKVGDLYHIYSSGKHFIHMVLVIEKINGVENCNLCNMIKVKILNSTMEIYTPILNLTMEDFNNRLIKQIKC